MGALARIGSSIGAILPRFVRRQMAGYRVNWPSTYFQTGLTPYRANEITYSGVFAAIDRISSDVAKIPLQHWKVNPDGTRRQLMSSAELDVWRQPNPWQTGVDLMKAIVTSQLYRGNAYVFCRLNNRNQVSEMYCLSPDRCTPYVFEGEVFYRVASDPLIDIRVEEMVPAKYVMHHRMATLTHPLIGVSPLIAAAATIASGQGIQGHTSSFFANMARPSGYLTTAGKVDRQRVEELKKRWQDSYGGPGQSGKTPILEFGLEYKQMTMTAVDAQLIEQLRWTIEDIARVFQIPAFLIGDMTRMMAKSAESMMQIYHGSCLGSHFAALEARINSFFELDRQSQYLSFDVNQLFRTDFDVKVASWAKAVQGGIATPNEAREAAFQFNPVEGGDEAFMQQQMVPLSMLKQMATSAVGSGGVPGGDGAPPGAGGADKMPPDMPAEMKRALELEVERRLQRWAA